MSRPVTIPQTVPDVVFFRNWWVETWFQILLDEVEQQTTNSTDTGLNRTTAEGNASAD